MDNREFGKREVIFSLIGGLLVALAILMPFYASEIAIPVLIGSMIVCVLGAIYCFWSAFHTPSERKNLIVDKKLFPSSVSFGDKELVYNEKEKTFAVYNKKKNDISATFKFSDINKFEVIENNESKVECSLANALVGDWLFGTIGGIAGAVAGTTIEPVCNELKLFLYIKSFGSPVFEFNYIKYDTSKKSTKYKKAFSQIKSNGALLEQMILNK